MPIYEYSCAGCGREMEILVSANEQGPQKCPSCGGQMRKLFSAHGVGKSSGPQASSGGGSCATGTCPFN